MDIEVFVEGVPDVKMTKDIKYPAAAGLQDRLPLRRLERARGPV